MERFGKQFNEFAEKLKKIPDEVHIQIF